MNKQREVIYAQRREVLCGNDMRANMISMLDSMVSDAVTTYTGNVKHSDEWDLAGLENYCARFFPCADVFRDENLCASQEKLTEALTQKAHAVYEEKEALLEKNGVDPRAIERAILLRAVDSRWMDHIDEMDQLRRGIGLRAYGNTDPVQAYNMEGYAMFEQMIDNIREVSLSAYLHLSVEKKPKQAPAAGQPKRLAGQGPAHKPVTVQKKVGRNDPCPCGSGKKYKNCCMNRDQGGEN